MWRVGELLVHAHESTPMKSTSTRWLSWNQLPWYEVNSHQINFPRGQLLIKVANGIWPEMWQWLNVTTHETTVQSCREEHNHPPDIAANQVLVTIGKVRERELVKSEHRYTMKHYRIPQSVAMECCSNHHFDIINSVFWCICILKNCSCGKLILWEVDLVGVNLMGGHWVLYWSA